LADGTDKADMVTLLCENEGAPIPRHRLAFSQPEFAGKFSYNEEYSCEARRTMAVARLRFNGADVLPALCDARLLRFENGIGVFTGFEVLNDLNRRRTSQTWKVVTAGWPGRGLDPE
jgi:hypothetical protein